MTSLSEQARTGDIAGIQYLRGVAVILVVLAHIEGIFGLPKYFGVYFAQDLLRGGAIGVDLFFVISGFIIYYVTAGLDGARISAANFAAKRFSRIIPFMWVCVLLHFALRSIGRQEVDFIPYLRSITLFPFGELRPNQIWTLRHEAFFYFFAGMCLVAKPWRIVLGAFVLLPLVLPNSWVSINAIKFAQVIDMPGEVFEIR